MKKLAQIIGLTLSSIFFFVACSPKEKTESNQARTDSVLANSSSLAPPPVQTPLDSSDFGKFIQTFDSPGTEISSEILSALSVNNEFGRYTSEKILRQDSIVMVLFTHMKQVGPGINELHAATFSKDGGLLEEQLLGRSYPSSGPDGGGEDYSYRYDAERKMLYITNSTIEVDENAQEEVTKEVEHSFQLTNDGKMTAPSREYPEVSERLLEKSELSNKTKEELIIMRNEPFAVYGYIFKNPSLKSYFESKDWYVPQSDNVNEQLNEIEKANIVLIKEVESTKK